jgi:hypothetical protein
MFPRLSVTEQHLAGQAACNYLLPFCSLCLPDKQYRDLMNTAFMDYDLTLSMYDLPPSGV